MLRILRDADLRDILWYKLGGKAKFLLQVSSKENVYEALEFIQNNTIANVFVCGTGANLILADAYYDGAIIQFVHGDKEQITRNDHYIEAFAGELLDHAILFGFENNLVGMEWAGGLPGTVGAAVRGNVGAYGGEIKDIFHTAEILIRNSNGTYSVKTLTKEEMQFEYRGSVIKKERGIMIVLSAAFNLTASSTEQLTKSKVTYNEKIQNRKDKHPLEYPNCGSVFKNIKDKKQVEKVLSIFPEITDLVATKWYGKIAAGYLIQKLGLQGLQIGKAQISQKHALFIVNLGGATSQDVLGLIDKVQQTFQEKFGFTLEPEVEIVR